MSERDYAAHAGISRGAVQKARTSGRLVLHADGSIDAAASDARRAQATDPAKQRGRRASAMRPVPEAAIGAVNETLKEQGLPPAAGRRHDVSAGAHRQRGAEGAGTQTAAAAAEGRADRPGPRGVAGVPPGAPGAGRLGRLAGAHRRDHRRRSRRRRPSHADGVGDPCQSPPRRARRGSAGLG